MLKVTIVKCGKRKLRVETISLGRKKGVVFVTKTLNGKLVNTGKLKTMLEVLKVARRDCKR